ncbi:MAG: FAD-dependent oxidoreductase [Bryobacteraceae bacterium]|nr:FAD-dependent oxidoreductase [Bryobacteraceae bacterium]
MRPKFGLLLRPEASGVKVTGEAGPARGGQGVGRVKYDPAHPNVRERYFFVLHEPFQAPDGVLVPKTVDGLLVPVVCSSSHVAYNAVRMEPVFMALGEASGLAAHLAIEERVPPWKVRAAELQRLLVERKGG